MYSLKPKDIIADRCLSGIKLCGSICLGSLLFTVAVWFLISGIKMGIAEGNLLEGVSLGILFAGISVVLGVASFCIEETYMYYHEMLRRIENNKTYKQPLKQDLIYLKQIYKKYQKNLTNVDALIKFCEDINEREYCTGSNLAKYQNVLQNTANTLENIVNAKRQGLNASADEKALNDNLGTWMQTALPGYYQAKGEAYSLEEGMNKLFGSSSVTKRYYTHIISELKASSEFTEEEKSERIGKLEESINEKLSSASAAKRENIEGKYQEALKRIDKYQV